MHSRKLRVLIVSLLAFVLVAVLAGPASASLNGEKVYSPAMAWPEGGYTYTVVIKAYTEKLPGGCRPFWKLYGFRNGVAYALNFEIYRPLISEQFGLGGFDPYAFNQHYLAVTGSAVNVATPEWFNGSSYGDWYTDTRDAAHGGGIRARKPGSLIWHWHYDPRSQIPSFSGYCDS